MKLQELWESLAASEKKHEPRPGGLGYRGVFMKEPGHREWTAFNGTVSRTTPTGAEARRDPARQFEKTLLSSAPRGMLPESMFGSG